MARYDGHATWYDDYVAPTGAAGPVTATADALTVDLLGTGSGRCLEIGCGGGTRLGLLSSLGWTPLGLDVSADQLRLALPRSRAVSAGLVRGDGARLPVATSSCDAVVSTMVVTDLPDLAGTMRETARVLRPGGRFVMVGPHPCFGMAFVSRADDGAVSVHPGYRDHAWVEDGPLLGGGIRRRVGTANVPLASFVNTVLDAGLVLTRVTEDASPDPVPLLLGLRAHKPH